MAQVTITINGQGYEIGCDDGQEAHLVRLAEYIDRHVTELVLAVGQVGEARSLAMACLVIADELSELRADLGAKQSEHLTGTTTISSTGLNAAKVEQLAIRIEKITESVQ